MLVAVLNQAGATFEIEGSVAIVFPAWAVAVVAPILLGWPGVATVMLGPEVPDWIAR